MTTIVTRTGKGSPLTWTEADNNFTNLNTDKVETVSPTTSGTLTHSGDVFLSGSGQRITGDFSNATIANRVMLQTSTVNGATNIHAVPSGTGNIAGFKAESSSDVTNSSYAAIDVVGGSHVSFASGVHGVGSYLPMTFYTGGLERMRLDSVGNVGIGVSSTGGYKFAVGGTGLKSFLTTTDAGAAYAYSTGAMLLGTVGNDAVYVMQNNAMRFLHDTVGNSLHVGSAGGLGYGTGAGGTVTQATSKSTAVTLNKPTGQITMNAAAFAAGATVTFTVNNSLVTTSDCILLTCPYTIYNPAYYRAEIAYTSNGAFNIRVTNISAGSLSEALVINFAIIKGATA